MPDLLLKTETLTVKQLVSEYRAGAIVIPEFQREYVWKPRKAALLVDSLYRGYPISSLLLWQTDDDDIRARRREPRPRRGLVSWLIDGQQRVITLSKTMSGNEGIDIVFNPETDEFKRADAATRNDRNWFHVADLWDDERYREMIRSMPPGASTNRRHARFERVREILQYDVPLVRMVHHTFNDAVEAFTRTNTLGTKLNRQDIESAHVAARHSGFVADEVAPFLIKVNGEGFTRLHVMHLFRACAFVAKPDGRKRTPLHELSEREVLSAWKKTKQATEKAIGLIRSEFGLVNMEILWSGALLVPIIVLCATGSPRERNSRALAGWLALATLLHRYSSSADTTLDQDLKACRAPDPIASLLANLRQARPRLCAMPNDFTGSINDRSGLLAAYIACMHRGVLDFFGGGKVILQGEVHRHHILPRGQFAEKVRGEADNVANIAWIAGDVNKSIGQSGPEVYLKKIKREILESQCVPLDKNLWSIDNSSAFWSARRRLLAESFNDYVRAALPDRHVGRP